MKNVPEIVQVEDGWGVLIDGELEYGPDTEFACENWVDGFWMDDL